MTGAPWKHDLVAAVPLAASLLAYGIGWVRLSHRGGGGAVRRTDAAAFAAGWITLAIALLSPIATVSEWLLSMHMTQHELLILVAAPLLTYGRPVVVWLWALPERWRRSPRTSGLARAASWLAAPACAVTLHALALWVWHLPPLYQAAVRDDRFHLLQHVSFTATACLFWWGLLRGRYGRLGYGAAVVYVFITAVQSGGLGALMTLSGRPWYGLYRARAASADAALADQQLAGLLMWIPAGVLLMLVALALFAAWLGECERRHGPSTPIVAPPRPSPPSAGSTATTTG
jgi:putative membrane protein